MGSALVAIWLISGVAVADIARYLAYELVLVGMPGVLAYRALADSRGGLLRQIAIGWPLGYAIELAGFILTGALEARVLLPALQLGIAAVAALQLRRGRASDIKREETGDDEPASPALSPAAVWTLAAVAVIGLAYLAIGFYTRAPLPGDVESVAYDADVVLHIELVAEAKHHWPMEQPSVTGVALPYHVYSHMHMGAVSNVTGIDPAAMVLRFHPAAMLLLVVIQLAAFGREAARRAWGAPLAALLVLLVGELDLDMERPAPFADTFFGSLALSPSYFFGIPLFIASALVLFDLLQRARGPSKREWLMVGALFAVCAGAKASVIPVVVGGLVLWIACALLLRAKVDLRRAATALGLAFVALGITYVLLFRGGAAGGFEIDLFQFAEFTVIEELGPSDRSSVGDFLFTGAGGIVSLAALLLPALGIAWVLRERGIRLLPGEAWLAALFASSLGAFALLGHIALGQAYFLNFGYIAGCVLALSGLLMYARAATGGERRKVGALVALASAAAMIAALAMLLLDPAGPETADAGTLALIYGIAAVAVLALAAAGRGAAGLGAGFAGLALALTIALGALNTPFDVGVNVARGLDADAQLYSADDPALNAGLTAGIYDGLRWVKENSDADDLIAVNNHFVDGERRRYARYHYYTAFSERRAFLESWRDTIDGQEIGYERVELREEVPYPELRAINKAVFAEGDAAALEEMRSGYGVDFIIVDKVHGGPSPRLTRTLGEAAFENDDVAIYRLS